MAKPSSKAMNNIVIFAMLIMIALFNLDTLLPKATQTKERSLLPSDAYILKIETDVGKVERTGQQWRQVTSTDSVKQSPAEQIKAWQSAVLAPVDSLPAGVSEQAPIIAVVWLAGKSDGLVFAFYQTNKQTYVRHEGNWYQLVQSPLMSLIPWLSSLTDQER